MVDSSGGVAFPVVFSDGDREINIGKVRIHSSLDFKNFQLLLSKKIGISPKQMLIYLVDGTKSESVSVNRRGFLITDKVNFSVIARLNDSYFLAVLKRSRRGGGGGRRRNQKHSADEFSDYLPAEEKWSPSPGNLRLLRRNHSDLSNSHVSGYSSPSPFYNQIAPFGFVDYSDNYDRLRNLEIQRQNYLMMSNWNANSNLDSEAFPMMEESYVVPRDDLNWPVCDECENAKSEGRTAMFHGCVYDTVTVGFRSPFGPIAPKKKPLTSSN